MAKQIVTVLCEGPHDVAFICRLLKSIGFKSNEGIKIGDYPIPFNKLLINEATKTDVEQLNLTEIRRNLLPSNVLLKEENYIFLYSLEGDGKVLPRQRILKELRSFIPEPGEIELLPRDTSLSLLYFFDADAKGVATRIADINAEIREALPEITRDPIAANGGTTVVFQQLKLGAYIFTGDDNDTGKLEDVLMPIMRQDNEPNFDAAFEYLQSHFNDPRLFPLKLTIDAAGEVSEQRSARLRDKEKYDEKKSLLGAVGQLQKSGKSNVVCISDSDYLTLAKIKANEKCQNILKFFSDFVEVR